MEVVGHRGCRGLEPENTLRAFRRGIDLGCHYVETDVRLTKDRHVVIMHDETVDRTTNGSGKVADLTLDAIKTLDAGKGEQVPTLAEVLEVTGHKTKLACELKELAVIDYAVRDVLDMGLEDQVVFTNFDSDYLVRVREIRDGLRMAKIFSEPPEDFIGIADDLGVEVIAVAFTCLTTDMITTCRKAGFKIRTWCPNEYEDIQKVIDLAPDGIGSDYPDRVLELLGRA